MEKTQKTEVWKDLTFKLTEKDFADKGKLLAKLNTELLVETNGFEDAKKRFKSRIAAKELEIVEVLKIIKDGEEVKNVRCDMVKVFDENRVDYVFEWKVLESRPMEAYERQLELDNVTPIEKKIGREAAFKDE